MFSRAAAFFALALPLLAAANELEARDSCTTGTMSCCALTQSASAIGLGQVLAGAGLLGVSINAILSNVNGLVGLGCTPITIIGAGSNSCSAQPVCCTDNYMNGAITAGCNPINL